MSTDPYTGAPNAVPPSSGNNNKLILVILVGVLVLGAIPCIGIVAAVSIPAFLRYTNQSKATEAEIVLRQMGNEAAMHVAEHCELPPELPPHADLETCSGGAKCLPTAELPEFWTGVGLQDPKYFVYSAKVEGDEMILTAQADFNESTPAVHTVELRLTKTGCESDLSVPITLNEFE